MQIAICDDEVSMVQILEEKIKKLLPDAVIEKYLSGDELIASGSKPDILFLDILITVHNQNLGHFLNNFSQYLDFFFFTGNPYNAHDFSSIIIGRLIPFLAPAYSSASEITSSSSFCLITLCAPE